MASIAQVACEEQRVLELGIGLKTTALRTWRPLLQVAQNTFRAQDEQRQSFCDKLRRVERKGDTPTKPAPYVKSPVRVSRRDENTPCRKKRRRQPRSSVAGSA